MSWLVVKFFIQLFVSGILVTCWVQQRMVYSSSNVGLSLQNVQDHTINLASSRHHHHHRFLTRLLLVAMGTKKCPPLSSVICHVRCLP